MVRLFFGSLGVFFFNPRLSPFFFSFPSPGVFLFEEEDDDGQSDSDENGSLAGGVNNNDDDDDDDDDDDVVVPVPPPGSSAGPAATAAAISAAMRAPAPVNAASASSRGPSDDGSQLLSMSVPIDIPMPRGQSPAAALSKSVRPEHMAASIREMSKLRAGDFFAESPDSPDSLDF